MCYSLSVHLLRIESRVLRHAQDEDMTGDEPNQESKCKMHSDNAEKKKEQSPKTRVSIMGATGGFGPRFFGPGREESVQLLIGQRVRNFADFPILPWRPRLVLARRKD